MKLTLIKHALSFDKVIQEETFHASEKTCIICFDSPSQQAALEYDWPSEWHVLNLLENQTQSLSSSRFQILITDLEHVPISHSDDDDDLAFDRILAFGFDTSSKKFLQNELINRFPRISISIYLPLCCTSFDSFAGEIVHKKPPKGQDLPITQHFDFPPQAPFKAISALTLDSAASRLFAGGFNFQISIWDFHTLSSTRPMPIKNVSELGGDFRIKQLEWSSQSACLLAINDSPQARLFSKDGVKLGETPRGDMYIKDLKQTRGHVSSISSGCWNPTQSDSFITCSSDGSVRFWNSNQSTDMKKQQDIILVKDSRGKLTPLSYCTFSPEGNDIWTASNAGSLKAYSKGNWLRPIFSLDGAHESEITCVKFSLSNSSQLITRSTDSKIKIWDLRQFSQSLYEIPNLPCPFGHGNFTLSPDSLVVGTGMLAKGESESKLEIFNSLTFQKQSCIPIEGSSVVCVEWNSKINQIFCGLSSGAIRVFWDDLASHRGIKQALSNHHLLLQPSKASSKSFDTAIETINYPASSSNEIIFSPFADSGEGKSFRKKRKSLPLGPEAPLTGHGAGGKIGTCNTAKIMNTLLNKQAAFEDPREALLKVAEKAKNEPFWCTPAYSKVQPSLNFIEQEGPEKESEKENL